MSEFLRAKKVAQARDAERAKELERLKKDAEQRKATIEREARERERRDRDEEIALLKQQSQSVEHAQPRSMEPRPRAIRHDDPKGPGSVALAKIRAELKKPSSSPSPVPRPPSAAPSPRAGPSTAPRSTPLPARKQIKPPTRNPPPKITAHARGNTARAKLAMEMAAQPTLHALNQNKRDLRSIDEIEREIKAAKRAADGLPKAKLGFFDDPVKHRVPPAQSGGTGQASTAGTKTAASQPGSRPLHGKQSTSNGASTKPSHDKTSKSPSKSTQPSASTSKPTRILPPPKAKTKVATKRREREPSTDSDTDSEVEYARKRRAQDRDHDRAPKAFNASEEIWKLFGRGKSKSDYVARDLSDSGSDMEVSAEQLAREEARTARIAREEDARAEAEERRHAEEKRKRLGRR